jgi:hypothetical protein
LLADRATASHRVTKLWVWPAAACTTRANQGEDQ